MSASSTASLPTGPALPFQLPIRRAAPLALAAAALLLALGPAKALNAPPGSGALVLRDESAPETAPVEAPRLKADVSVEVSGPTARAVVTQAFKNTTDHWVEGTYVYPLPEDAAVDTMKLVIGERIIVANIRERAAAKREYEAAKAAGKSAALTEQERPNVFTNAVANIGPGETVLVQIEYQQPVRISSGTYSLRVPLVVAPRYNPAPPLAMTVSDEPTAATDPVPDRARISPPVLDPARNAPVNPVSLRVRLKAGFAVAGLASVTHPVRVEEDGPDARRIALADGAVPADRDFELTWRPAPAQAPEVGLFREHVGADDYLLAMVTPPENATAPRLPRDVVFVIDNSGSMAGASIRQAKAALLAALDRLGPGDRFNVIRFDHTMDSLYYDPVPADEAHLASAKAFVAGLQAQGGTEMLAPLKAALADPNPEDVTRTRQILFLTDGAIGNEEQIFSAIGSGRGRSRLFMVGIGSAPNGHLMTHAALIGRGSFTAISTADQVADRMRELFAKLENPVVTDLTATFSEAGADVTPGLLPDLYRGEPLVLSGKLGKLGGSLTLRGRIGGQPWARTLALDAVPEGSGISKVWARAKIGEAETVRITGRESAASADASILKLALEHGLMTRLTSLVAVDATPRRPQGARLASTELPLNLPAGWDFESVFGPQGEGSGTVAPSPVQRRAEAGQVTPASLRRPALPVAPAPAVNLPQTATDYEIRLWLGLALLMLALFAARARRLAR